MKKYQEQGIIMAHEPLTPSIYHMVLHAPHIAAEARPGQFVTVRVGDRYDPLLRRPFSFFGIRRNEGIIEIAYRVIGRGTTLLSHRKQGTSLNLFGPLGNGFRLPPSEATTVWFLAGGIGIAALVPCLHEIKATRPEIKTTLYYGAKSATDLFHLETFAAICDGIRCATDDGSMGFCGSTLGCAVQDFELEAEKPSYVYACGPPLMLKHVARWVSTHRIPAQFCLEAMMGCGVGACLGCALPKKTEGTADHHVYAHVCFEGPVFSPEVIQWDAL